LYGFSLIQNDAWSDDGLKRSNHCKSLMVLLHDGISEKYID